MGLNKHGSGFGSVVEYAAGGFSEIPAEDFEGQLSGDTLKLTTGAVSWNGATLLIQGTPQLDGSGKFIRYSLYDKEKNNRYLVKVPVNIEAKKAAA